MTWPARSAEIRSGTFMQPRTLEVLFWRSRGLRRKAIAERTGMCIKTVDSQIVMAREALGVDTRRLDCQLVLGGELKKPPKTLDRRGGDR